MSFSLTDDVIRHLAQLAQLPLSDEATAKYTTQVSSVFDLIQRIQELDLAQLEEKQSSELTNIWRDDVVEPSLPRASVLANTPKTWKGYVVVPGIFTEEV